MCGIFAYAGSNNASKIIHNGLSRLEYRGYDSWGITVIEKDAFVQSKKVGQVGQVKKGASLPKALIGIGHTRWATHGAVTEQNAHPHIASDGSFCLAQNGIVENYKELKKELLEDGYQFKSETDTEVIVGLIEREIKKRNSFVEAVRSVFLRLEGRNTIIILNSQGEIYGAKNGSPLVVGKGANKDEIYFSSDVLSLAPYTKKVVVLENGQIARFVQGKLELFSIKTGKKIKYNWEEVKLENGQIGKEGFDHYMLKEINESPYTIRQLTKQDKNQYEDLAQAIKKAKRVFTIGSGSTGGSAAQIAFYLRTYGKLNAIALIGAEARDYFDLFNKDDLIISPSQSGETADVLEVLEVAKARGTKIVSVVNMPGSTMTRMSDFKFMVEAGPEICVVSTKVYLSHICWGYLIGKTVSSQYQEGVKNLNKLANEIENYLKSAPKIKRIKSVASKLKDVNDIYLLGKHQNMQIVKEGMVKLIETAYKHAHAFPAGDLKHYAITLMEEGVPVIIVISKDEVEKDVVNAMQEVKARGAKVIGISSQKYGSMDEWLEVPELGETSALFNIIPLQLLTYYLANLLGYPIDKPRNIAKSVTVK